MRKHQWAELQFELKIIICVSRIGRLKDIVNQLQTNGRLSEQIKSAKPDIPKIALFSICFVTGEKMFGNPSENYFHLVDFSSFHKFLSIQFDYDRNWFIQCTGCQNDWLILSHASHYSGVGNLGKWN